jgi:UDP-N-acetylglucosamine 2-epimerase (non-hydrolysing)
MINISVVTGTRADYGLLFWLLKGLQKDKEFELEIVVTGSHLSDELGNTYRFIENDGFTISKKVEILNDTDTALDTAMSTAEAIKGFSTYLEENDIHILVVLGDRYEAFAAASSAMFSRVPVFHIHGGEVTSGAYDDMIRHSITKMSQFHSTSNDEHMKRVIQLGESPDNVRNLGAPGLEHFKRTRLLNKKELSSQLDFDLKKFFLVTYHPETLSAIPAKDQISEVLEALDSYKDYNMLFTFPNADDGGKEIIHSINNYSRKHSERALAIPSLGQEKYFSALACCDLVVGNSSSGIIEAPSAGVPSINIGERQLNRCSARSVIHCNNIKKDILNSIELGLSEEFRIKKDIYQNPYGEGKTSEKIISWLKELKIQEQKFFYDLV